MREIVILSLAASGTALATGLGAIPVFLLGARAKALTPSLLGFAAGVMLALIVVELLPTAYAGPGRLAPSGGIAGGAALMLALSLALGV